MSREATVVQFCTITGASAEVARQTLEACEWQLDVAINLYVDGGSVVEEDDGGGSGEPSPFEAVAAASGSAGGGRSAAGGRGASRAAKQATSSESAEAEAEVRAPIPQKTETLVTGHAYGTSLAAKRRQRPCVFRDIRWETQEQEDRLVAAGSSDTAAATAKKPCLQRLEAMFRPPMELLFNGSYEEAKASASMRELWLLVDVQNQQEFGCLTLNRDLWSRDRVKALVRKHCVMMQLFHDSEEGSHYCRFHGVPEWPHVAVLHPATGERIGTWTASVTAQVGEKVESFVSWLSSLVVKHPNPTEYDSHASTTTAAGRRPPQHGEAAEASGAAVVDEPAAEVPSILDEAEERQLQYALQQSLKENQVTSSARYDAASSNDDDDDDYGDDVSESDERDDSDSVGPRERNEGALCETPSSAAKPSPGPSDASFAVAATCQPVEQADAASVSSECEWRRLLGNHSDPVSNLVIRLPDQSRKQWSAPCSTPLEALLIFIKHLGYPAQSHDIVVNFPRRVLNSLDVKQTLAEIGLHPQETVFVHHR